MEQSGHQFEDLNVVDTIEAFFPQVNVVQLLAFSILGSDQLLDVIVSDLLSKLLFIRLCQLLVFFHTSIPLTSGDGTSVLDLEPQQQYWAG